MSRRAQENIAVLLLIALFAAMIVIGMDYTPRARLVSFPVAVIGLGLALAQLAWQNFRSADDLHVDALQILAGRSEKAMEETNAPRPKAPKGGGFTAELAAFAIVAAVTTSFFVFGALPTTFVFCTAYLAWSRQSSLAARRPDRGGGHARHLVPVRRGAGHTHRSQPGGADAPPHDELTHPKNNAPEGAPITRWED